MSRQDCKCPEGGQRQGRCRRLRQPAEFRRVYETGRFASGQWLVVHWLKRSDRQISRLGVSVGKKHGNAAIRARWKRLFRETFRQHRDALPEAMDIVLVPRLSAVARDRVKGAPRPDNPPPLFSIIVDDFLNVAARIPRSGL